MMWATRPDDTGTVIHKFDSGNGLIVNDDVVSNSPSSVETDVIQFQDTGSDLEDSSSSNSLIDIDSPSPSDERSLSS